MSAADCCPMSARALGVTRRRFVVTAERGTGVLALAWEHGVGPLLRLGVDRRGGRVVVARTARQRDAERLSVRYAQAAAYQESRLGRGLHGGSWRVERELANRAELAGAPDAALRAAANAALTGADLDELHQGG